MSAICAAFGASALPAPVAPLGRLPGPAVRRIRAAAGVLAAPHASVVSLDRPERVIHNRESGARFEASLESRVVGTFGAKFGRVGRPAWVLYARRITGGEAKIDMVGVLDVTSRPVGPSVGRLSARVVTGSAAGPVKVASGTSPIDLPDSTVSIRRRWRTPGSIVSAASVPGVMAARYVPRRVTR